MRKTIIERVQDTHWQQNWICAWRERVGSEKLQAIIIHFEWVKKALESGSIGKVRYMESQFVTSDYDLSNIYMRRETNGGAMYDLGCYTSSMITWILGRQPDEVKAAASFSPEGVDLLTTAIFTYHDDHRKGTPGDRLLREKDEESVLVKTAALSLDISLTRLLYD